MGQVLHSSATTTEAIRRTIQQGRESLRALAARYGINLTAHRSPVGAAMRCKWEVAEHCWDPVRLTSVEYTPRFKRLAQAKDGEA